MKNENAAPVQKAVSVKEQKPKSMKKLVITLFAVAVGVVFVGGMVIFATAQTLTEFFGLAAATRNRNEAMLSITNAHYQWRNDLNNAIVTGEEFKGSLDPAACSFGKWLVANDIDTIEDPAIKESLTAILTPHEEMHHQAGELLQLAKTDEGQAVQQMAQEIEPRVELIVGNLIKASGRYTEMAQGYSNQLGKQIVLIRVMVGVLMVVVLAMLLLIVWLIIKKIVIPIVHLTGVSGRIAAGDLSARAEVGGQMEIRRLANSLNMAAVNLQGYTHEIAKTMQALAKNDLTVEIQQVYLGDFADIKGSINQFVSRMNRTIHAVANASEQVHTAASYVSTGSAEVAHGAAEQASAAELLSDEIARMAEDIKESAAHTTHIQHLSETVGQSLVASNGQMQGLTQAMQEIDQSSQQISKIIKTIEDIAAQTNILALNAAVEAARAGVQGKGFAVVADEVRSLATKSSQAAQQTHLLVESSVRSVKNGVGITNGTARSLEQVVGGAQEITAIVAQIAESMARQTQAVGNIGANMESISAVMHVNTAASEESAATSEQLNAQAGVLQEIVEGFELRAK